MAFVLCGGAMRDHSVQMLPADVSLSQVMRAYLQVAGLACVTMWGLGHELCCSRHIKRRGASPGLTVCCLCRCCIDRQSPCDAGTALAGSERRL